MIKKVITITLKSLIMKLNCYLIKTENGYILIDTGAYFNRRKIEMELKNYGCNSENLKLIILTHGDPDHSGNAAYLRKIFNCKIILHQYDSCMLETGDMFCNRSKPGWLIGLFSKLFLLREEDKCKADLYIKEEQYDLSEYGFEAKILHLPGHSDGSIGILTNNNLFFCGDLFHNFKKPEPRFIEDKEKFSESLEKIKKLNINVVYPGHGKSFTGKQLQELYSNIQNH